MKTDSEVSHLLSCFYLLLQVLAFSMMVGVFFRAEGAGFGAVSLCLHQHALLVPANRCCSDTFTEIPLSYVMTNKPSSACVIYHSMCCFFAGLL